jgi:hypothetical protein
MRDWAAAFFLWIHLRRVAVAIAGENTVAAIERYGLFGRGEGGGGF